MIALLCMMLAASGAIPKNHRADDLVDLIELNHFYDQQGRLVFDQVIFYEQSSVTGRFQVRAWCLVDDREILNRRPIRDYTTDRVVVEWYDTDKRVRRRVTSRLYRESWTQVDPERADKHTHPEHLRRSLSLPKPDEVIVER